MTSQLDTSGDVERGEAYGGQAFWSDLSPFTQGYIEALFADHGDALTEAPEDAIPGIGATKGFSDLAPETLARIIADCGRWVRLWPLSEGLEQGRRFWALQQGGMGTHHFPSLTVQLGDDGKVRFA